MRKAREVYLPSVDTKLIVLAYDSEEKALTYAMKRAVMSCGAKKFREVLPTDKTPEQVIQAVCEFLRSESSKWDDVGSGIYFAALVEAKKERILE